MAWKNVQYENGKYRTSSGGGGGASNLADLDDVDLNNLQDGQIIKWDATNQKFINANESGSSSHTYSTTEQVVGTWIDGKPVYEKTITTTLTSTGTTDYSSGIGNIGVICQVNGSAVNSQGNIKTLPYSNTSVTALNLLAITNITPNGVITFKVGGDYGDLLPIAIYVTIQYTKTTD